MAAEQVTVVTIKRVAALIAIQIHQRQHERRHIRLSQWLNRLTRLLS